MSSSHPSQTSRAPGWVRVRVTRVTRVRVTRVRRGFIWGEGYGEGALTAASGPPHRLIPGRVERRVGER